MGVNPEAMARRTQIAVIWDMDGVIVDTAPYHFAAWQQVFEKRGVKFTEANFKRSFGRRNETIIPGVLNESISAAEIAMIAKEKEGIFRRLGRNKIKPLPGAVSLIKRLAERRVKMALVSSTPARNIKLALGGLGIADIFQTIISAEDVVEGKPNPEGFLLAAGKLEVRPENCVVIEDSTAGVSAAKRAGMSCVAVTNTRPRSKLGRADLIIDSLETIDVSDLEKVASSIHPSVK